MLKAHGSMALRQAADLWRTFEAAITWFTFGGPLIPKTQTNVRKEFGPPAARSICLIRAYEARFRPPLKSQKAADFSLPSERAVSIPCCTRRNTLAPYPGYALIDQVITFKTQPYGLIRIKAPKTARRYRSGTHWVRRRWQARQSLKHPLRSPYRRRRFLRSRPGGIGIGRLQVPRWFSSRAGSAPGGG